MKLKKAVRGGPSKSAGWVRSCRARVAQQRPDGKCSQAAFAKLLDPPLTADMIAKLEQGVARLTPAVANRIARALLKLKTTP